MCVVAGVCMHARIGPTACVFSMMSSVVIVAIAGFRTQPPSLNMCALKAGFLRSFAAINLKRLESRPLRGQPNKYRFFVEIEGSPAEPHVAAALDRAKADGATIRSVGSYPSGTFFES